MFWIAESAAIIHITASGLVSATSRAAAVIAGALLRPIGSSRIRACSTPAARTCSATRKRCSWLQTSSGAAQPAPIARFTVSWISVSSDSSGQYCFGKLSRDTGQSRDPEPPDRMTGTTAAPRAVSWEREALMQPVPGTRVLNQFG